MSPASEWIAVVSSEAARHFAPDGIYFGIRGAVRFAREIGYGLADFEDGEAIVQTTYSRLVQNTFGSKGGVPIDSKLFLSEVNWALQHARLREPAEITILKYEEHCREIEKQIRKCEHNENC